MWLKFMTDEGFQYDWGLQYDVGCKYGGVRNMIVGFNMMWIAEDWSFEVMVANFFCQPTCLSS